MPRKTVEPAKNERNEEEHPAFGMIGASRGSSGGTTLFDSDIQHQHTVMVRIATATRRRDLNRDWLYRSQEFVEVEMSEAQWASFVSSMNSGSGVPCTIRRTENCAIVPNIPHEQRLAASMGEVRAAGEKALAQIRKAFDIAAEKPTKANMRNLGMVISNAVPNMEFTAQSLSKHAENVVQRARADIEAMVVFKAQQLGLDPGDISAGAIQLTAGDPPAADEETT